MKIVLLSGGSGKRLWPLSSDSRSKQFLKILPGEDEFSYESMVQRIWRQLKEVGLTQNVFITANAGQIEIVQQQLGKDAPCIVEPERKDTLPAILLSVLYLHEHRFVLPDEVIMVLPVDSYVDNALFLKLAQLEKSLLSSEAEIALIGVNPTYPSAKYGYIIPQKKVNSPFYQHVSHFIEKPTEEIAETLIADGALWNCGIFAFKASFLIQKMQERGIMIDYDTFFDNYTHLTAESFDYEILEKSSNIIVDTYEGYWKDLGTWNTLTEEIADSFIGKGKMSVDCENTHVINELNIPIHVLGISNAVVAASPEGILVTDKASSPRLKELLSDFQQRSMYEEKSWGWYKIIDHTVQNDQEYTIIKFRLFKDAVLSFVLLQTILEYDGDNSRLTVLSGKATVQGKYEYTLEPGVTTELEVSHTSINFIQALTELEFIIVNIKNNFTLN